MLFETDHTFKMFISSVSKKWAWSLLGKGFIACPSASNPLQRWRSCKTCMLGSLLPCRWPNYHYSSCCWTRSLPKTCGASAVCSSALYNLIWCLMPVHHFLFLLFWQFGMIKFPFESSPSDKIALPALRTLGNIAAGNDVQTQVERTMYNLSSHSSKSMFDDVIFILCGQGMIVRLIYKLKNIWYQQVILRQYIYFFPFSLSIFYFQPHRMFLCVFSGCTW